MEMKAVSSNPVAAQVRPETLSRANDWVRPTPDEVKEIIRRTGRTDGGISELLGLTPQSNKSGRGNRTVRRWTSGDVQIPYAAWALLAYEAGAGVIWK